MFLTAVPARNGHGRLYSCFTGQLRASLIGSTLLLMSLKYGLVSSVGFLLRPRFRNYRDIESAP